MRYGEAAIPARGYKGWFASEKMDGWHVLLDSTRMVSRSQRRRFSPPFDLSVEIPLAAELLVEGEDAPAVASLLSGKSKNWSRAALYAFDTPDTRAPFRVRTRRVAREVRRFCGARKDKRRRCPLRYLRQQLVRNDKHLDGLLRGVSKRGGEGLVLTASESRYVFGAGRSRRRVKVKPRHDTEGVVSGRRLRDDGTMGSLLIRSLRGEFESFHLGTGFSAAERRGWRSRFANGTVVTFSYRSLTRGQKPKEARFLRIRVKE